MMSMFFFFFKDYRGRLIKKLFSINFFHVFLEGG